MNSLNSKPPAAVAYFSMEVGLDPGMPTYAGGLGVLAGDTLRSAADLGVPMVCVTLLHRKGSFRQRLDASGRQTEEPIEWNVGDFLVEQPERVAVVVEGRSVRLRSWKYEVKGTAGIVPAYFIDADLPENSDGDRTLTHFLYGGDDRYRLCQEMLLGIGGVRMLRALGYSQIDRFHMNEGHSSLLVMELLEERMRGANRAHLNGDDAAAVRRQCIFTTHTPVPAGHDQFPLEMVRRVLGDSPLFALKEQCCLGGRLNLTYLALNFSHYVNGVAMKHGEVSRQMFGGHAVDAITNGVHAATWAADEFQALFDRRIPEWRRDNFSLRYALGISREEIRDAHAGAKRRLIERVMRATDTRLDPEVFTIGLARRAAAYKRAELLVSDTHRLKHLAGAVGPIQVIHAGKAHPRDGEARPSSSASSRRAVLVGRAGGVSGESRPELSKLLTGRGSGSTRRSRRWKHRARAA
jgi:starch phosphorylase